MEPEMHLTGSVAELGVGMCGSVVEEMVDSKGKVIREVLGGYGAKGFPEMIEEIERRAATKLGDGIF